MGWKFYLMHWEWQFYMNFKAILKIYKLLERLIPCRPKCSTTKYASHMIFTFNRINLPHVIRIQLWIFFRELKLECPIWFLHSNIFYQPLFCMFSQNLVSPVICHLFLPLAKPAGSDEGSLDSAEASQWCLGKSLGRSSFLRNKFCYIIFHHKFEEKHQLIA